MIEKINDLSRKKCHRQTKKTQEKLSCRKMRRCLAVALCLVLSLTIFDNNVTFVRANQETQNQGLDKLFNVSQLVTENGRVIYEGSGINTKNIKAGIMYQLEKSEKVSKSNKNEGMEFISSDTIYSSRGYNMCSARNQYSGILVAENDIHISGNQSILEDGLLFSKNGNILISGNTIEIQGIIYAPAGSVVIDCDTLILKGMLITNKVDIHARECKYRLDNDCLKKVMQLEEYQIDSYADITMYYNNEKGKIGIEDIQGQDIMLYTRYGNGSFELQKNYQNGTLFDVPAYREYFEAYAEFTDQYGEKKISDIESFGSTEEGLYCPMLHDDDKDGIPDGYEMRDGLGNPNQYDTEKKGISDGEDVLIYGNRYASGSLEVDFLVEKAVWEKIRKEYGDRLTEGTDDIHEYIVKAGDSVNVYFNEDGKKVTSVYNYILNRQILESVEDTYIIYFYDLEGNILVKLAYDGENQIYNAYTYNDNGVDTIVHNDITYSYKYDNVGRIKDVLLNGKSMISAKWVSDRKCIRTMANGFRYIMEYNEVDQMIRVSSDEKVLYEWEYADEKPHYLLKSTDHVNGLEYSYKYDGQGEVSEVSCNDGTSYTLDNGVTEWGIETLDKADKEQETYQIKDDYYVYLNGSTKALSNDLSKQIFVDGEEILETKVLTDTENQKTIKQKDDVWKYVYNEQGLLKDVWKNDELSCKYEYNNVNELIREDSLLTGKTIRYYYDGGGNIQKVVSYPLAIDKETSRLTDGAVDARYCYDKTFPDRLISFQGKQITYDEMGNPLDYWNGYQFSWTQGQRLENIANGDSNYSYSYDMDGYRMSKTVDSIKTSYTYHNGVLVMEKLSGNEIRYHYAADGDLLYFEYKGKAFYYELDECNTVVGILDDRGNRLVSYGYDAWGKIVQILGDKQLGDINPFRYRSYYYDKESGFYYLHNRYYDPVVRRMISMDQYTDTQFGMLSHNMYAYCENTPVNASNYTGNIPDWVKKLKVSTSRKNYLWKTNSVYNNTNCYGYAIKDTVARNPGHYAGIALKSNFSNITDNTKKDLKKLYKNSRQVTYEESNSLSSKHIVIALRLGYAANGKRDYHYMRRVYDSKSGTFIWTHKPGTGWGGVLIHKHYPAKLDKWPFEFYNANNKWVFNQGAGYSGMIVYYAYWN